MIAKLWAMNIIDGKRTFSEVPEKLQADVAKWLIKLGHPELIEG